MLHHVACLLSICFWNEQNIGNIISDLWIIGFLVIFDYLGWVESSIKYMYVYLSLSR